MWLIIAMLFIVTAMLLNPVGALQAVLELLLLPVLVPMMGLMWLLSLIGLGPLARPPTTPPALPPTILHGRVTPPTPPYRSGRLAHALTITAIAMSVGTAVGLIWRILMGTFT